MLKKVKKHSIVIVALSCLFLVASSFGVGCLCLPTRDYKLDRVAYALNDYNRHDYYNGFQPSILRLHQQSPSGSDNRSELYNDIFEEYYYNSLVQHFRQYATNDIRDELINTKINVYCQRTYLCRNNELSGGGHYVDFGIFASYYGDQLFNDRPEGDPRSHAYYPYTGCYTFAYISDSFADSLISYYQEVEPESNITNYIDLIFKKPVLPIVAIKVNKDGTTQEYRINVSINNILYTKKREAYRISNLYGTNFALIDLYSYGKKTREWADLSCEMDLKADPFGTKNVINGLERFGYSFENTVFEFYKYDYSGNSYYLDRNVGQMYLDSFYNNVSISIFYVFSFLIVLTFFVINILYIGKDRQAGLIAIFSYLFIGLIFGTVASFCYFYPLWTLAPSIMIVGGTIINLIKRKKVKGDGTYVEIYV